MTVNSDDIEISLGRLLTDSERDQVDQWIGDAGLLVFARLGDLTVLNQDILNYVVREAVLDRLRNPDDGVAEESESIDDYSHTRKWSATKRVRIWPEWWALLSPGATTGAWTIRPGIAR